MKGTRIKYLLVPLFIILLLLNCYFGWIRRAKNSVLEFDTTRTFGQVFDNYEYFTRTSWIAFPSREHGVVVRATGILRDEVFRRQIDAYFEKYIALNENQPGRREHIEQSKSEILERVRTLKICVDFSSRAKLEKNRIAVYSWSINRKDIDEERPYFAGPYDLKDLKYLYENTPLEISFAHLHKYFYH